MGFFAKIAGLTNSFFQLGGAGGNAWNYNSAGATALEGRNAANAAFVNVRGADPTTADDLATKRYVDAGAVSLINLFLDAEPTTPNTTYSNTITGSDVTHEQWVRTSDSSLLKTIDYTFTNLQVTMEVRKIFAADGVTIVGQTTYTYTYTGTNLTGGTIVRNV